MKKVQSAINDGAAGNGWFKLWDQGYDESSNSKWCTLNLNAAGALMTVNLPKGLVGGAYLIRPELLALHNANVGDPQYYTGCAQIFLTSSGNLVPQNTVSIPGYVRKGDASDSFNLYNQAPASYPLPGPAVASFVSGGNANTGTMMEGGQPVGCLLEKGSNWCGVEVPDYNDMNGCWAVSLPSLTTIPLYLAHEHI